MTAELQACWLPAEPWSPAQRLARRTSFAAQQPSPAPAAALYAEQPREGAMVEEEAAVMAELGASGLSQEPPSPAQHLDRRTSCTAPQLSPAPFAAVYGGQDAGAAPDEEDAEMRAELLASGLRLEPRRPSRKSPPPAIFGTCLSAETPADHSLLSTEPEDMDWAWSPIQQPLSPLNPDAEPLNPEAELEEVVDMDCQPCALTGGSASAAA